VTLILAVEEPAAPAARRRRTRARRSTREKENKPADKAPDNRGDAYGTPGEAAQGKDKEKDQAK
jgi:hypothetical protein